MPPQRLELKIWIRVGGAGKVRFPESSEFPMGTDSTIRKTWVLEKKAISPAD